MSEKPPHLEGLKLPGPRSIFKGIFSDHISWIYEPASLLVLMASYYSHKYFYDHMQYYGIDRRWAFAIPCWIIGVFVWWILALFFLALDHFTGERGKLYKKRTTISTWRIIPVVLRNHCVHLIFVPLIGNLIFDFFGTLPKAPEDETIVNILMSCIVCGLAFEVVFFSGHYLEHVFPKMYRKFHLLHHTTKADTAISGYYMTVFDYMFEGPVPMLAQLIPVAYFNLSSVAVIHGCLLNIIYAITAHAGWKIPGVDHPGMHWLHHNHVAKGGEGINYATHFNMMDIFWNTKSYAYLEIEKRLNLEEKNGAKKVK